MYTLQVYEGRYRWLYSVPNSSVVAACGIDRYLDLHPFRCSISYPSMQEAHEAYPDFKTILTTETPAALPETHPELFI